MFDYNLILVLFLLAISISIEEDPDNTVSIMLDGIESRLHVINIDIDLVSNDIYSMSK